MPEPLVIINVVALTPELLQYAPNIRALADRGASRPLEGVFPALTMPAQASMLTGVSPNEHGVVANGWYWRKLGEVRNWVQSNQLLDSTPLYESARQHARERGCDFTCAKMFWWFNQGANVDWSVTPKPHYGADGSKAFDILSTPGPLSKDLEKRHGRFPFFNFWGPKAGLPATRWIAEASASLIKDKRPTLSLVYLPHLDYDLQRKGPAKSDLPHLVADVDACAKVVIDAAQTIGAKVLVVSEYGISNATKPVYPNRLLRKAGLLEVRYGPFGEMLDTHESKTFAVCDHQIAHVYVRNDDDIPQVKALLSDSPQIARVLDREEQRELSIDHPNSGELVVLATQDAWLAYPYWLDDMDAPDFARTVDIHRKPGYDPCELFLDPSIISPTFKVVRRLIRKKLGFRTLMDVIPLDASIVKGSHGLPASDPNAGPVIISSDAEALPSAPQMTDVKSIALRMMELD